ncbi:MAG: methionine synthase [Armatimonadota bacterium]
MQSRVLICDGAAGTQIQATNLTTEDFDGLDGCNEYLNLSRPDVIAEIHCKYLEAGADVIQTNTFGAIRYVLDEYDVGDKLEEISAAAARIAREQADRFSTPDKPRFVLGGIGPGTRLVTLGNVSFDDVVESYRSAFIELIRGGVDGLLLETLQDLLHAKAGLVAVAEAMEETSKTLPVFVQVTMEQTGTMLMGSDILAVINAVSAFPYVICLGLNCATGPEEMVPHVRALSKHWPGFISVQPNAGLPVMEKGEAVYKLTPEELATFHRRFVSEFGVNLVGGCCGTTPKHIEAVAEAVAGLTTAKRDAVEPLVGLSSLYQFQPYDQSPSFLIVGERTNANGSKMFRELLAAEDWQALTEMAREQEREGAHVLDVCAAYVGRDEARDMDRLLFEFARQVTVPIMIDSTEVNVIEASLKRLPGKPVINSINFEDGDARTEKVLTLCRKYGAAVVGLTIDEKGMAKTKERKVAIADRILEWTRRFGIPDEDVFIDALTFTLGSGDAEFRSAGIETIAAIREIKRKYPRVNTLLGVSNISFGLKPHARHILNSVFLHYALEAGLTSAIVHSARIMPEHQVDKEVWEVARRLVFNERTEESDPLVEFMALFENVEQRMESEKLESLPIEERLKRHIIDGTKKDLERDLDEALQTHTPLQIINDILLDGMKVVGDLFGEGKMQLPFVLQSAEVMKAAVKHLEPKMEKVEGGERGSIVLATVAGDVHDIGKNLVDIILSNNGFRVVNIGIKQPLSAILQAAEEHKVQAIGMSGLLVKSTVVMKDNLAEMNELGKHHYPVLLGGAALTRGYVEQDLRSLYKGKVWYAQDAFEGLKLMKAIAGGDDAQLVEEEPKPTTPQRSVPSHRVSSDTERFYVFDGVTSDVAKDVPIPEPPFLGRRVATDINIEDVYEYINEIALFRGQWGFRRPKEMSNPEFQKYLEETAAPRFERLKKELRDVFDPRVVYGYFPAQSEGNDLILYDPETREEFERITFPRQATDRRLCIADFFAPKDSGRMDVAAFHLVTIGSKVTELERKLFAEGQYEDYLLVHGMGVETAEALAEYWHKRIRQELGIADEDPDEIRLLFSVKYRGCRYSFGYPACPNLEDQATLFRLLGPEEIGVELTEEFMLVPEQSTSAIICHHPDAKYFNLR